MVKKNLHERTRGWKSDGHALAIESEMKLARDAIRRAEINKKYREGTKLRDKCVECNKNVDGKCLPMGRPIPEKGVCNVPGNKRSNMVQVIICKKCGNKGTLMLIGKAYFCAKCIMENNSLKYAIAKDRGLIKDEPSNTVVDQPVRNVDTVSVGEN